jgi:hypothetical protein
MRFSRLPFFAIALFAATTGYFAPLAKAQQDETPVAIVSIAPLDRMIKDAKYLIRACNVPEFGGVATTMASYYTQGLDQNKPLGVAISLDGQMPVGMVFLPLSDREKFFETLAGIGIEPDDLGDGLFEIDANGQTLYAKDAGGWLYIAQSEEALSSVPANPAALLGELPKNYNIAIKANIQSLPPDLRDMAASQMKIGFDNTLNEQSGQTDEEIEIARKAGEAQIAQIEELMRDTDQLILGFGIDSMGQKIYLDGAGKFLPDTKLAKQSDAMASLTSDYTAFKLAGSSANFRATSQITTEADKEVAKQNVRNSMQQAEKSLDDANISDDSKALLVDLMSTLEKLLSDTIDEGTFDGASSLSVADSSLRVLVGGRIADGRALETELQKLVKGLPASQFTPTAEFGYETYKGITLHRLSVPVKIADPNARKVFGDELKVTIGTADKAFFVALDPTGDGSLKSAIDNMASAKAVKASPFNGVIQFAPLLEFAQAIMPNPILDTAVDAMKDYADLDKVQVMATAIPRGGVYRLSIDEGVLRAGGTTAKLGAGGGGGF